MYHGIINVYKEAGYTSHDAVAKLRGICKQKKIGHTGTLDPDAVGVLPVCLGNATKACDLLTDRKKEYIARLRLGCVTDTQDLSGHILEENAVTVTVKEVREAIASFEGESLQVPPMYSALKINGKKLYELARAGKEVERPARPITVYQLEIMEEEYPEYTIKVVCSKGTYIRTLCHDIGQKLGCGGVMVSLKRTRVGEFEIKDSRKLSELQKLADEGRLTEAVCPVDRLFENLDKLVVKEEGFKALINGNPLKRTDIRQEGMEKSKEPEEREQFRIYSSGQVFFGIYRYESERRLFLPVKLFLGEAKA